MPQRAIKSHVVATTGLWPSLLTSQEIPNRDSGAFSPRTPDCELADRAVQNAVELYAAKGTQMASPETRVQCPFLNRPPKSRLTSMIQKASLLMGNCAQKEHE